jgi:hypothetical protein
MTILILKLCILGLVSPMNYQSALKPKTFSFSSILSHLSYVLHGTPWCQMDGSRTTCASRWKIIVRYQCPWHCSLTIEYRQIAHFRYFISIHQNEYEYGSKYPRIWIIRPFGSNIILFNYNYIFFIPVTKYLLPYGKILFLFAIG